MAARKRLPELELGDDILHQCADLCQRLGTDGLRAELTLMRSLRAMAALNARQQVVADDLRRVAPLVLRHRLRRNPLDDTGSDARVQRALQEVLPR